MVAVKAGFSIKDILSGLCERHGINGAAADLFLVGGDKVLGPPDPHAALRPWPPCSLAPSFVRVLRLPRLALLISTVPGVEARLSELFAGSTLHAGARLVWKE